MQSALDESNVSHEDYRIKEVMDTWMNQNRYPVVNVEKNYETGEITISQKCFHAQETDESIAWWIPITFATQSNPNFSNTVPSLWLRPNQNISFEIKPNDWIIVNLQQTGKYKFISLSLFVLLSQRFYIILHYSALYVFFYYESLKAIDMIKFSKYSDAQT